MAPETDGSSLKESTDKPNESAHVGEEVGDIFASPKGSVLIHACNTKGVWGAGVALQFKKRYPIAYRAYRNHCLQGRSQTSSELLGTTFFIPPDTATADFDKVDPRLRDDGFYVACLFTSNGYGKNVDPPDKILDSTAKALDDLANQIGVIKRDGRTALQNCRSVKINSGKFGVDWPSTRQVLENGRLNIVVVSPEQRQSTN